MGRVLGAGALVLGGLAVSTAALAEIKWALTGANQTGTTGHTGTDCGSSCASLMGNTRTFAGGAGNPSVTAQAWSNTGGVSGSSTTTSTGTLETAYLGLYSGGLGAKNRDGGSSGGNTGDSGEWSSPEHAVDNQSRYDSVLFSFTSAVDLGKVEIGYLSGDSDITVLAYTGMGAPSPSGDTYTDPANITGLTNQGWTFIGHYTDLANNTPRAVNTGDVSSAYWLIGGYIPGWGDTSFSKYNDHVKLLALYGDKPTTQVPEPNALLLLGLAFAGVWATRRRTTV
jgi:hypothetical protein